MKMYDVRKRVESIQKIDCGVGEGTLAGKGRYTGLVEFYTIVDKIKE